MSFGYMFIARSDLGGLAKIRGFSFYRIDSGSDWHVMARHDHEGGKIVSPLEDGGRLTSFGQEIMKSVEGNVDVHFCFFLLDRNKTEQQVLSHMKRCVNKRDTIQLVSGSGDSIKVGAVYKVS